MKNFIKNHKKTFIIGVIIVVTLTIVGVLLFTLTPLGVSRNTKRICDSYIHMEEKALEHSKDESGSLYYKYKFNAYDALSEVEKLNDKYYKLNPRDQKYVDYTIEKGNEIEKQIDENRGY